MTQLPSHRQEEIEQMILFYHIISDYYKIEWMLRMTHLISAILEPPFPMTHPMISLGTVISWVWCVLPPRPPPPANAARAEMDIFQIFYFSRYSLFFQILFCVWRLAGSPAGERTPGPNPVNPFNPLMLVRPPPAGPWGSSPPFPICTEDTEQSSPGINPWIQMSVKD